jgi:hypothetical protein
MKTGDLVKFKSTASWSDNGAPLPPVVEYGVIVKMSTTGHSTESAEVFFNDGDLAWVGTQRLVVMNECR